MRWGDWLLNPGKLTLTHEGVSGGYEIDLERINSAAQILDWIFQVQGKSWADATAVHDLLRAFEDVLDPQANYCSGGRAQRAEGGALVLAYVQRGGRSVADVCREAIDAGIIQTVKPGEPERWQAAGEEAKGALRRVKGDSPAPPDATEP
jgi:hypothetical protein